MAFDVFPTGSLFDPETEIWRLRANTINGGVTTAGPARKARTDGGGLWTCEQANIELYSTEQLLAASALDVQLDGGVTRIIVPCFSWPLRPVPAGVSWSVEVSLAEDAPLRASVLSVIVTSGRPLIGGEPFSMVHATHGKRLYRVRDAEPAQMSGGVMTQAITIRCPLREATTAGAPLDFETPGCVMRLVNPENWLSPLDPAHEQSASPIWVEAF